MPESGLNAALRDSVVDVLETMFFVRSTGDSRGEASAGDIVARVHFEGEPSGNLTLRMSALAARSVSADFLGEEDWNLAEHQIGEVVCELANMVCGSFLSRVESNATFRLDTPCLASIDADCEPADVRQPVAHRSRVASHSMEIAGGALRVFVETEARVWSATAEFAF